jgi:hypothetical protein
MPLLIAMLFGMAPGFFLRIFMPLPFGAMAMDGQRTGEWLCSQE